MITNEYKPYFERGTINTFRVGFWFMWKLRVFGKKLIGRDSGYICEGYVYKNTLYVTRCGVL